MPPVGYDAAFLPVLVPLPSLVGPAHVELTYTHFTVLLRPDRRLAAATAVNIDGARLRDVDRRGVDWRLDGRIRPETQAGEEVYKANDLDRGHLVRRRDPVWGDLQTASAANLDSFHYTNAAPQVAVFNQSKELWLGLEDYILGHAETTDTRLSVFTGPVLADDDPRYRGVQLPRQFWKIAAWMRGEELAATGYLLDQSDLLGRFLERQPPTPRPAIWRFDLGSYRTFQVPIAEITATTGVRTPVLELADRLPAQAAARAQATQRLQLTSSRDLVL